MAGSEAKLPVKTAGKRAVARSSPVHGWHPFEGLRHEIDRLFDEFDRDFWRSPFQRTFFGIEPARPLSVAMDMTPAVDIVEKDGAYELTVELPGLDEKNIEVKVVNGSLTIKGEKEEEQEEKKKDYYLHERSFGSFERSFALPEGVDADKIDARFKKGVLLLTLPKKPETQKPVKKIAVKAD